jgi:K+ transporter
MAASWRRGRQIILERTSEDNPPLDRFIRTLDPSVFVTINGELLYADYSHLSLAGSTFQANEILRKYLEVPPT